MNKNTTKTKKNNDSSKKFLAITGWISTDEATKMIKEYINSEEFDINKGEIKKSSYRFTNGKDKTDGYICRVMLIESKCQVEDTETVEDETETEIESEVA